MGKVCFKCGKPVDPTSGYCPRCFKSCFAHQEARMDALEARIAEVEQALELGREGFMQMRTRTGLLDW